VTVHEDLDHELAELLAQPVTCRRCGTPFPEHNGGGAVRVAAGGFSSPAAAVPVTCPGFLWVDPGGPPVGSYGSPPVVGPGR
jgi:hypothetical protein